MTSLDIIIVNWNAGDHLRRCLEAVARSSSEFHTLNRLVIVDNASTDGSLEGLPEGSRDPSEGYIDELPIVLVRNSMNRGFAAACNQGAEDSEADYLLFLNPDTRPEPDAFDKTVQFLEANSDAGIAGAQLLDDDGRIARTCARPPRLANFLASLTGLNRYGILPGIVDEQWDHSDTRDVAHVMGAYLCVNRNLFEQLGGFDEGFFVYYEDVDLAARVRQHGNRVVYVTNIRVNHTGCGASELVKDARLYYSLKSRLYFCYKYFGVVGGTTYAAGVFTVELFLRLIATAGRLNAMANVLRAYGWLARSLPSVPRPLSARRQFVTVRGARAGETRAEFGEESFRSTSLDIVIVNWNAGELILQCVESIGDLAGEVALGRVVIVDNASTDGSIEALMQLRGTLPLSIIRNDSNRGFAVACNQGARGSTADYILFLNSDTRLKPGALRVPARHLDDARNADVGIVGIQLVDEEDRVLRTCARLPTPGRAIAQMAGLERLIPPLGHFESDSYHHDTREVDQVMGAFFFTRRSLFEDLGGFDERFFVFLEEVDFSLRARQAGYKTVYLCEAQAYHRGAGTTEQVRDRRLFYVLRSRILYFFKHFSPVRAGAYVASVLTLEFAARTLRSLLVGPSPVETISGYRLLWRDLPAILRRARS